VPLQLIRLPAIKESSEDYERLEARIKELFRAKLYLPVLAELGSSRKILNASDEVSQLIDAIQSGRVTFGRGTFQGKFNAGVSRELRALGASWDRKQGSWKVPLSSLPDEVRAAIQGSLARFEEKLGRIDRKLSQILPEEIAEHLSAEKIFDRSLWRVDEELRATLEGIAVAPELTAGRRRRLAAEWENNLKLYIRDFSQEEISKLRQGIQKSVFAGNRYETAIKTIQKSFEVSQNKAKFLARQETSLLMTKFKETRYTDAGVLEYEWRCVAGSKHHPVRAWHKALEGKIFRWDNPPITTKPGEAVRRNNPGQDFGCRCFAKPLVKFRV
jgi:SPP1 gp7 family putative phage head morphogenesis protein